MKPQRNLLLVAISFFAFCTLSCEKNDHLDLIKPEQKALEISCGADFDIQLLTDNWAIESASETPSGKVILDNANNPIALYGGGYIESSNGWLAFSRKNDNVFTIHLKENFDRSNIRRFTICVNSNGNKDYMTVTQRAGKGYKVVKTRYLENLSSRKIYTSTKGCSSLTLTNNTSKPIWEPSGYIFQDVVSSSTFESKDYGAFDWMPASGVELLMPELLIDNTIWWDDVCVYKEGTTTTPYIKDIANGNKLLIPPFTTTYLKGEITYCKRLYDYRLTIENTASGSRFDISGSWTHVVPISSTTISSNEEFI